MTGFAARIDAELDDTSLHALVVAYYDPDGPFAGHTFDLVGENPPNQFTTGDLLALTTLDVACSPPAIRALLHDERLSRLLGGIPAGIDLWDAGDGAIGAATTLWEALTELPDVGPTTAGKLLARKRPRLIPIWDSVVEKVLQPEPGAFWESMRAALADERRRHRIDALADGVYPRPTTLRTLDVAIWMRHGRSRNVRSVGGGQPS